MDEDTYFRVMGPLLDNYFGIDPTLNRINPEKFRKALNRVSRRTSRYKRPNFRRN